MESLDGIPENAALITQAGARASFTPTVRGRHPAAQPGRGAGDVGRESRRHPGHPRAGDPLDHREPRLGAGHRLRSTGTLEKGKAADVVLWSGDPFSVYSKADIVWNDGRMVFDRSDPKKQYRTDFNLGTGAPGVGQ